jgi:hypothetical protein
MNGVSEVFIVLPNVWKHDVQTLSQVSFKGIFSEDPVVQVVGVSQVLRVLEDAAAVVQELGLVEHVGDLGDVELKKN